MTSNLVMRAASTAMFTAIATGTGSFGFTPAQQPPTSKFWFDPTTRRSALLQPGMRSPKRRLHTKSFAHLTDDEILAITRDWFDRIVVGWNLCPFADRPNREGNLKIEIVRGSIDYEIVVVILDQCILREDTPGTTLVVAPECHPNSFEEYLSFCTTFDEELLPKFDLDRDVQIAPFHPLFQFADSEGVDVWTNRSPFPIFHILREEEVSVAVSKLDGDSSKVWKRNIRLLKDLEVSLGGEAELEKAIRNADSPHAEEIRSALQRNRFSLDASEEK